MITYRKMSELSLEDLVALWNRGFEGYFVNIEMNLDKLLARVVNEGLSLEHSLAMYDESEAIGFVMNGFRVIDGKKVAWNGGTGITSEYRGKGIGKRLMERNLQLYREQGVDIALLEAIMQNERAIKLYQNVGYVITEQLNYFQHAEALDANLLQPTFSDRYAIRKGLPFEIKELTFYRSFSAWQTQWPSMKDGEGLIVSDGSDVVGYALFKRIFGEDGKLATIALYQCESIPGHTDAGEILKTILNELYAPLALSCKRLTINLRDSNKELIGLLKSMGFTLFLEQVHMELIGSSLYE